MKIAITSTVSWPYIRRGSRITYELAAYLARQGHEVSYISIKPGGVSRRMNRNGVALEYHRLIENPLLTLCRIHKFDTFSISCLASLLKDNFDIVQSTFPMDAFAASIYQSISRTPFVHYMFDRFYPRYYITSFGKLVFKRCIKTASRVAVISNFIRDDLKSKFGIEGIVIPGTVDVEQFSPGKKEYNERPYILSMSTLTEPRKRIALLVKSFERLLDYVPNATLKLSGHTVSEMNKMLLDSVNSRTRKAIDILGVGRREDLPKLYRNAAVSVIPSINEAFGLVILESLASGTPVVGTKSGGIPDILNNPEVGILVEESDGPEKLCQAIIKGMELGRNPATKLVCRRHAESYSWNRIGPLYENLYAEVINNRNKNRKKFFFHKKKEAKKTILSIESHEESLKNTLKTACLSSIFDAALDERETDYVTYYKYESYKPFCTYIGAWLLNQGFRSCPILILGAGLMPSRMFLEKCGYIVTTTRREHEPETNNCDETHVRFPNCASRNSKSENYDAIIWSDIPKKCEDIEKMLLSLRDRLKPEGVILVTAKNRMYQRTFSDRSKAIKQLAGKSIIDKSNFEVVEKQAENYPAYNASEIERLIVNAGFALHCSNYIIERRPIEGSFFHAPIVSYLHKQFRHLVQKTIPCMRSHIFIAAYKNSG